MTTQDKALTLYKESLLSDRVQDDLNSGCSPDDDSFIQGVFDQVYSLLSKTFTEEEMDEIEIGDVLDDTHFS